MNNGIGDTIAAIATANGQGAIAVIRVSGPLSIELTEKHFRSSHSLARAKTHTVHFGRFVTETDEVIDDVLITVFKKPHSYTGEDSVEISCHGGSYISSEILRSLVGSGMRYAEPGEFTKRAFLNGKMNLSQAEAVADLIASRSSKAHQVSLDQLQDKLGKRIEEIRADVLGLASILEVDMDFSEEGLELIPYEETCNRVDVLCKKLDALHQSFKRGKIYREGLVVAIVGKPNTGKSSLFNALLNESRAIVTDIPGTTRDSIEESIVIEGIEFKLVDTAGLRDSDDIVEKEGMARTYRLLQSADIILNVRDSTSDEVENAWEKPKLNVPQKLEFDVFNKIDLLRPQKVNRLFGSNRVATSAKTGEGLSNLREKLIASVQDNIQGYQSELIFNERHKKSLEKSIEQLKLAKNSLSQRLPFEFVAFDIRQAAYFLGEITGTITSEDVLNEIFHSFCIGK